MSSDKDECWFAVRCVFASGLPLDQSTPVYEERITLWLASSAEGAIQRAEAEALEYAGTIQDSPESYLGIAQSYRLFDAPADGAEVFSLMRVSTLEPTSTSTGSSTPERNGKSPSSDLDLVGAP